MNRTQLRAVEPPASDAHPTTTNPHPSLTALRLRVRWHEVGETPFTVRRERVGDAVRVDVEGELDAATAPLLAAEVAAAGDVSVVVADLAGVTLLDSTALLALLRAALELRTRGGELVVRPPDGSGRRLLDLIGLERPLTVLADLDSDAEAGACRSRQPGSLVTSLPDENARLRRALESRIVIEQAKGILAERLDLSVDAAFALMRRTARHRRQRLRDLATAIVDGSEEAEKLRTRAS